MNHAIPEMSSVARTSEIKAQAAAWLQKHDFDAWTDTDSAELESWLAQSHFHRAAYWRLAAAWEETYRLAALRRPGAENAEQPAPRSRFPFLFKIAAAFTAVAALGMGAMLTLKTPQDRTYATAVGGHEVVRFADGSQIELNTDTVLHTRMTTEERTVWLEKGEAFFKVKHDAAHPMVVIAHGRRIVDLGTQFLVRLDGARLNVALLEGRVRVGNANLAPGDEAIATATSLSVSRRSIEELTNEIAWRNGVLVFRHATLEEAANVFNRYSDRKLIIPDPAIASQTIGGTFRTNDIEAFAAVVRELSGLRVAKQGNTLVITR